MNVHITCKFNEVFYIEKEELCIRSNLQYTYNPAFESQESYTKVVSVIYMIDKLVVITQLPKEEMNLKINLTTVKEVKIPYWFLRPTLTEDIATLFYTKSYSHVFTPLFYNARVYDI